MPKYYPLFPKCPFLLRDLSPTYFLAPTSPHPNLPRSGQLFCRADSRDQQTDSQQTDRTTRVATDIIYASLRIAVQPSTEKSIQFFTSFTTEQLVRLTGLRPRIHCLRCLKSLCISTALYVLYATYSQKSIAPSPQWQQNDMPRPFPLLLVATLTSAFELQPGTSAGLWLGGQCPLAA